MPHLQNSANCYDYHINFFLFMFLLLFYYAIILLEGLLELSRTTVSLPMKSLEVDPIQK